MKYPPFCDITVVNFNSLQETQIQQASTWVYEFLQRNLDKEQFKIFKPMPAPIDKIQNRYRWRIILKGNMTSEANDILNQCLKYTYEKNWRNTKITIDVNPNNMM